MSLVSTSSSNRALGGHCKTPVNAHTPCSTLIIIIIIIGIAVSDSWLVLMSKETLVCYRNLSACGGAEVCENMVRQDVLTPLTALLNEVRERELPVCVKRNGKRFCFGNHRQTWACCKQTEIKQRTDLYQM